MCHRCILLVVVASLALSGGAAWATSVFVDINTFNNQSNRDIRAYPTGVSPLSAGGGVVMQGAQNTTANPVPYYDSCYYSGGTSGVMSNLASTLTYGTVTFNRSDGDAMNDNGDFTNSVIQNNIQVQWLTTNQGTNTTYYQAPQTGGNYATRGIGIDGNDDICGAYYGNRGTTADAYPYVALNSGGSFTAYTPTSSFDSWVTAMTTPTTSGGVTSGYAVGFGRNGSPPRDEPEVWSYSITGGVMSSSVTNLMGGTNYTPLSNAYAGVSQAGVVAINSSGKALIAASTIGTEASITSCTEALLYDMTNQAFTPLTQGSTSLLLWDPIPSGFCMDSGHDQAINNAGQVVGYIGAQGSTWHAAMWQNGVITDLNTEYASVLPAGVTLNMATAIDNNGDIAGVCTDASGDTMQAFVIYNTVPEPGTLVLSSAGLAGLLVSAWRWRRR
jgi:probable HAF family extracellular repeat protein